MTASAEAPRALALAGPTASGKTALALAFAEACRAQRPVEIISVDSALVYRGMDVGTAKPDAAERQAVPHHLIDIIDPTDSYSAARFCADAERLVEAIRGRGHLPLLVGGTMLYFSAAQRGLDSMPAADAGVRAEIDARAAAIGWPALHAELARVDPATAARLPPGDTQRIQRALEVWQISGQPLSAWQQRQTRPPLPSRLPFLLVSLEPQDRAWLHARIAQRLDTMLTHGLLAEVAGLRARGDLHPGLPSMRCVGYRQAWEALDAGLAVDASTGPAWLALREKTLSATRQLAKRQLTWLRSMPHRRTVACDSPGVMTQGITALKEALQSIAM
jgi:tRNA dimethylallyltransferase